MRLPSMIRNINFASVLSFIFFLGSCKSTTNQPPSSQVKAISAADAANAVTGILFSNSPEQVARRASINQVISEKLGAGWTSSVTEGVRIVTDEVRTEGDGCPPQTFAFDVTADMRVITLIFDAFILELLSDDSSPNARSNCKITIPIDIDPGWLLASVVSETRGFYFIDPGVEAIQTNAYSFVSGADCYQPGGNNNCFVWSQRWPNNSDDIMEENFILPDTVNLTEPIKANICSSEPKRVELVIDSQLELIRNQGSGEGFIAVDSLSSEQQGRPQCTGSDGSGGTVVLPPSACNFNATWLAVKNETVNCIFLPIIINQ